MPKDEEQLELELVQKGLTAPRLTPAMIDSMIAKVDYHIFPGSTVTVCAITLTNGFTVVDHSACVSAANFDAEVGRSIAFKNAREQIWAFAGFGLCEVLNDHSIYNAMQRAL